jgi:predicted ATPase
MKLAYLYIKEHKVLKNINIPINSEYKCHYSNENLTLKTNANSFDYYQGLSCSAIIGKNGVGKSTILDFIETAYSGTDSSGIIVWFDSVTSKFHICPVNIFLSPSSISSHNEYVLEDDLSIFVKQHKIKLIKANNLTGVEANDFSLNRKSNKFIYDMSLSQYVKGSKGVVAQRTNRLIRYFNSSVSFNHSEQPKVQFTFKFNPSSTSYLKSLLKDKEFVSKYINNPEDLKLLKHQLNSDLSRIDLGEYQNIASQLLRSNTLSIFSYLSRTSLINKLHQNVFFIRCLLSHIKGEFNPDEMTKIIVGLRVQHEKYKDDMLSKTESLLLGQKYHEILNTLGNISHIQHKYIQEYTINKHDELSSFNADYIIDLTNCISRLPSMLVNNMPYGWNGFSTGEFAKLNIFSELYTYIHNEKNSGINNHLIVMDEVDLYLHPDWQRTFLSELLDFINVEFPKNSVQLILSTHSPIIISDFLPEDIVSLDKNGGKTEIVESFGFGSHITDLYIDGMHLKSTFGEHSKKAINNILNRKKSGTLTKHDLRLVRKIKSKNIQQMILGSNDKN